jgi:hypothetical protein
MPAQPHARRGPPSSTSLESGASSVIQHLRGCLYALGEMALAEKVQRCCSTFRALACANGHMYQLIPAERCRHRRRPHRARWRQQRAITRLWPAIHVLRRRHPGDRWVLITLTIKASREPLATRVHRFKRWLARLRRTAAWKSAIRGAEGSKRLGACVGDLARVQPLPRLGSGGRRRA